MSLESWIKSGTDGEAPAERLAERLSAASYGTILVLAALIIVDTDAVADGWGWELLTGVGVATWLAHFYAEMAGDHIRHGAAPNRRAVTSAMLDGLPIPLAAFLPAMMLLFGRLDVLAPATAIRAAVITALLQLVGVGAMVGLAVSTRGSQAWAYAAVTALFGIVVVLLKTALGH